MREIQSLECIALHMYNIPIFFHFHYESSRTTVIERHLHQLVAATQDHNESGTVKIVEEIFFHK